MAHTRALRPRAHIGARIPRVTWSCRLRQPCSPGLESARSCRMLKAQPTRSFIISLVVRQTLQRRIRLAPYLSPSMVAVARVGMIERDRCGVGGAGAQVREGCRVKEISRSSKGPALACRCASSPSAALELTPPNPGLLSMKAWPPLAKSRASRLFSDNVAADHRGAQDVEEAD